jgi:hypothetical protein
MEFLPWALAGYSSPSPAIESDAIFVDASREQTAPRSKEVQERPRNAAMPDLVSSAGLV